MERKSKRTYLWEALALVIILTILAAMAIPNFLKFQAKAKDQVHRPLYQPRLSYPAPIPPSPAYPPAHGGSVPPNAVPYDAMFFESQGVNPFIDTDDDWVSTFAVDVDTASYTISRKYLFNGHLPPQEAVRVEEFVNYFKYDYPIPSQDTFSISLEGLPSPFGGENYHLLRIGIQGQEVDVGEQKNAVLTLVIDVSGSMSRENRLEMVKQAIHILLDQLGRGDQVGVVVFNTTGRVLLDHLGMAEKRTILRAIDGLYPDGSTNTDEGLRLGFQLADAHFREGAINRVILLSDGVANEGTTDAEGILDKIEWYASRGIALTTIGFGLGNYNDVLMEKLADQGDGNYAYVDTLEEAKRVFDDNLVATLQIIAKDVKVQLEFNREVVSRYRLIGYENRDLKDKDFRNNRRDAGEIGAGHQVTALYEFKLHPKPLRDWVASVTLRSHDPAREGIVKEQNQKLMFWELKGTFAVASPNTKLAAAAAEFAEILRKSYWAREGSLEAVIEVLQDLPREFQRRPEVRELIDLVNLAKSLQGSYTFDQD